MLSLLANWSHGYFCLTEISRYYIYYVLAYELCRGGELITKVAPSKCLFVNLVLFVLLCHIALNGYVVESVPKPVYIWVSRFLLAISGSGVFLFLARLISDKTTR